MDSEHTFIRIDHFLIPISRITEINYLPTGIVYKIGKFTYFDHASAAEVAGDYSDQIEPVKEPILIIYFINTENKSDFIRRSGEPAQILWDYLTMELAAP